MSPRTSAKLTKKCSGLQVSFFASIAVLLSDLAVKSFRTSDTSLLSFHRAQIRKQAWLLVAVLSSMQILSFPLPGLYVLTWISIAPLLVALLQARDPETLQLDESRKLVPARPWQGFLLGYACGVLWYLGTCYWVYDTMHQYGGLSAPVGLLVLLLFALYLGLYHGSFGLLVSLLARKDSGNRLALLSAPFLWVAIELARTRISGFPWDLLGITQVDNIPLTRVATVTGVYGLSFEILLVNVAFAATFLVHRSRRRTLMITSLAAASAVTGRALANTASGLCGPHGRTSATESFRGKYRRLDRRPDAERAPRILRAQPEP